MDLGTRKDSNKEVELEKERLHKYNFKGGEDEEREEEKENELLRKQKEMEKDMEKIREQNRVALEQEHLRKYKELEEEKKNISEQREELLRKIKKMENEQKKTHEESRVEIKKKILRKHKEMKMEEEMEEVRERSRAFLRKPKEMKEEIKKIREQSKVGLEKELSHRHNQMMETMQTNCKQSREPRKLVDEEKARKMNRIGSLPRGNVRVIVNVNIPPEQKIDMKEKVAVVKDILRQHIDEEAITDTKQFEAGSKWDNSIHPVSIYIQYGFHSKDNTFTFVIKDNMAEVSSFDCAQKLKHRLLKRSNYIASDYKIQIENIDLSLIVTQGDGNTPMSDFSLRGASKVMITAKNNQKDLKGNMSDLIVQWKDRITTYLQISGDLITNFEIHRGSLNVVFTILDQIENDVSALTWAKRVQQGLNNGSLCLEDESGVPLEITPDSTEVSFIPNVIDKVHESTQDLQNLQERARPSISRDQGHFYKQRKDVSRFIAAVKDMNLSELRNFERLYNNNRRIIFVNPMLFVAAFGTPEVVDIVCKWEGLNIDELCNIPFLLMDFFEGMPLRNVSPLHVAAFFDRETNAESIIKYSSENDMVTCLRKVKISDKMEAIFMRKLAERLKEKYTDLQPAVIPGHRMNIDGKRNRVFIVYSRRVTRSEEHSMRGIAVIMFRNPYFVDKRMETSTYSLPDMLQNLSERDIEKAQQAMNNYSDILWKNHSNLNIIRISPLLYRRKKPNAKLCIVLYCSTKGVVPLGEPKFPTKLKLESEDYIDVDVCERYFQYGGYDTRHSCTRHEKLKMGCSIGKLKLDRRGNQVKQPGGTLGPFVTFHGHTGFLTCAHVVLDHASMQTSSEYIYDESARYDIVQPATDSTTPSGAACGFVHRAIFDPVRNPSIDVAVVQISDTTRIPDKRRFANDSEMKLKMAGFDDLPEYNSGFIQEDLTKKGSTQMFIKFGSETHITKGYMAVLGSQVRPLNTDLSLPLSKSKFKVKGQYEIIGDHCSLEFFRLGDSGSAVFILDPECELHCIGMAIGCTRVDTWYPSAVVTPIGAILNALENQYELKTFT